MRDDKKAKLVNLLADTNEAFYWIGFLMADGTTTESRIAVGLALRDNAHLCKFGEFVEYSGQAKPSKRSRKIACMDKEVVPLIRAKFGFKDFKTENPPDNLVGRDEQKIAFIAGFIDGDGCMKLGKGRRFGNIAVKVHGLWLPMLKKMANFVYGMAECESGLPKLNKKGYAEWVISNSVVMKFLKRECIRMKLPVLSRKWNKISLDVGIQEEAKEKIIKIRELASTGLNCTQVAQAMNETIITVWQLAKTHGIDMNKYNRGTVQNV